MPMLFMTLVAALLTAGSAFAAQVKPAKDTAAEAYPSRPVRLIVPFPPGGSNDIMARNLALHLTGRLGRQVVVDNRPGADALIGTELAARSLPDGYTLLVASAAFSINGATRKVAYDPQKSFAWIGTMGLGPSVLTVGPSLKVDSLKELLAHGRAAPGKVSIATSGGFGHFASELFNHMSGMKMLVVVYKGGIPALLDVMGGQANVNLGSLIQTLPHFKSGRLKALATSGLKRAAAAPELPTISEAGVPGYEANNWWALAAPAGTPPGIVAKLSSELTQYLKLPETLKRFEADGVEAQIKSPAEVQKMVLDELVKWRNVAKIANIRTE
jgi:tripartite-type tricarboxylate transporter receptor subunit TctC